MSVASSQRAASRSTDYRRVVIREVNMTENFIVGEGGDGQKIKLNFDFQHPIVAIPAPGEFWTVVRNNNEWRLDRRMETGDEQTSLSTLMPGDRRIEASGNLYLAGTTINVNGSDLLALIDLVIPAGLVAPYSGDILPLGWDWADGATVDSIADPTYARLWNNIGTKHGGTGPNNFKKPDIQGRMVVGQGTHADVLTLGATEGLALASRTMKHYHAKGNLAVAASGAHGHTLTGTPATITGGAHGHTFTGSASTSGTESAGHTHALGSGAGSVGGATATSSITGGAHTHAPSNGLLFATNGPGSADLAAAGAGNYVAATSSTTHTHPASEHSGNTSGATATHTHTVTPLGTLSATDTHTHSYTPAGTLSASDTHVHNSADFTGVVGTTAGVSETSAYIVLPHIIKL